MSQEDTFKQFEKICQSASTRGYVSSNDQHRIREAFGERADKALALVSEKRVKKYVFRPSGIVRWVVAGIEEGDHLVLPHSNYCSCEDFFFQVLGGKVPACAHIIAQKMAETMGEYETLEEDDGYYRQLLANL